VALIPLKLNAFEFLVGTFDASLYVSQFGVSVPLSEYNREYLWSGSFSVAYTLDAKIASLTPADFDHETNPGRWEDGQQAVKIKFNGYSFPWLYIKDYRWDSFTNTGSGTLIQLPELLKFDRIGDVTPGTHFGLGVPLKDVVNGLLLQAGRINGAQIVDQSQISIPSSITGSLCVQLISTNPLVDAQKFAAANAQFLYQKNNGVISTKIKPELNSTPLFVRGIDRVIPDKQGLDSHFAANKVIVSGSKEVGSIDDTPKVTNPNNTYDHKGRAKAIRTLTYKNAGELFPDTHPQDQTQIVVGSKTVFYRYIDDENLYFHANLHLNMTTVINPFISRYPSERSRIFTSRDQPIQTVTCEEKIIAEIFSGNLPSDDDLAFLRQYRIFPVENPTGDGIHINLLGDVNQALFGFIIGNLTIETELYRVSFSPAGVKFSSAEFDNWSLKTLLVIDQHEELQTPPPPPFANSYILPGVVNPKTGKAQALEPVPKPETAQLAPNYKINTVAFTGTFNLSPTSYNTFLPKEYQETFGYLDSQQQANDLARKIAYREWGRKRGKYWTMEIPTEWMANGFEPFPVCDIFDSRYIVENPSIVYQSNPPTVFFKFFGEKIGSISEVPRLPAQVPFIPTGALQILPSTSSQLTSPVGSVISLQLAAIGGTSPYTWSATSSYGLSISSSGLITGTITTAFTGTWTITVTDALSVSTTYALPLNFFAIPVGTPVIQPLPISNVSIDLSAIIANIRLFNVSVDLSASIANINLQTVVIDLSVTFILTITGGGRGGS
jgi:hypothetical protein